MAPAPPPAPDPAALPGHDPALNIHQRMMLVTHRIGFIPKLGEGPQSQGGYAFARDRDIKDRVRDECVAAGVAIHVSMDDRTIEVLQGADRDGRPRASILATVVGSIAFVNVDDPAQVVSVGIHGQGLDTQDKALSKATTSAVKYGLLNAFVIPTGDDPDAEGQDVPAHAPRPRSAQRTRHDDDEAPPPQGDGEYDPGVCPKHGKAWRNGQYGWYCPSKDADEERGYCRSRPSKSWQQSQER
ncbi:MAG: ERF family protein [Chloroflexi bacterium]|nr:ERF family protein [Chloroflexota bacterium]